jgi:hypothetical protein
MTSINYSNCNKCRFTLRECENLLYEKGMSRIFYIEVIITVIALIQIHATIFYRYFDVYVKYNIFFIKNPGQTVTGTWPQLIYV